MSTSSPARLSRAMAVSIVLSSIVLLAPRGSSAQDVEFRGRIHGVQPPSGYYDVLARYPNAYQFEDVWKEKARRVRERRAALVRGGDFATLNRHMRGPTPSRATAEAQATAVTGDFKIPVLIGYFADSTQALLPDSADLDSLLFSTISAPPYSVTTFYDEMSAGLVNVTGEVIGWFAADTFAAYYEGTSNGLTPGDAHTGDFITELLDAADPSVDFSDYDNDGDGKVDLVAVLHPLKGGECGGTHIWAHRWVISAWTGSSYTTGDGVTANDYMIQSAVGGSGGCDDTEIMPIGTFSHELGHGMDLPDLYDTSGATEGIGEWGLMGSGNWNIQSSPAHMMAWSKDQLGWIAVDTISDGSGTGDRLLDPIIDSDTALRVDVSGTSEYFLLENRHAIGSDAHVHGEGLLIWHIDPDVIAARESSNTVNASFPHGVALEQADGDEDLENGSNRGDSGDPYPGLMANTVFGLSTTPNSELNDGSSSALKVDSITVNGDESIAFRVRFNLVEEVVTTSVGAGTEVIVDGSSEPAPFVDTWEHPSSHTIGVDSIQGDTLVRHVFQSWSDGGAREHSVTADAVPDTFVATLETQHRLKATADSGGTVTSSTPLDSEGVAWLLPTDTDTLIATADSGVIFAGWSGDTTSTNDTLSLVMSQPYTVNAEFGQPVAILSTTLEEGLMGASYADTLEASGGAGSISWYLVSGSLPPGLSLDSSTGVISGAPEEDDTFEFVVRAESFSLTDEDTVSITVTRPSVSVQDAADHLLGETTALTVDERNFLDLIGNGNGSFDIGDFRAFLQETGVIADAVPADLSAEGAADASASTAKKEKKNEPQQDRDREDQ